MQESSAVVNAVASVLQIALNAISFSPDILWQSVTPRKFVAADVEMKS